MRTTLTIDDDLAGLLKKRAKESGVSFKETVNRALRAGLGEAAGKGGRKPAPKVVPFSLGFKAGIDQSKLGQLVDQLEDEAIVEKMRKANDLARRKRTRLRP
jgi:hypothetical protein